ncbi:hypothetical protein FQN55_008299 [Onygenales sp. PD_40]|nr:hypothetical protein FQN55_008299 [Onygenales sp. PD_40]KAK2800315.1 hypothetical protein FQN51_006223 [Onygenales sp. PD_10]
MATPRPNLQAVPVEPEDSMVLTRLGSAAFCDPLSQMMFGKELSEEAFEHRNKELREALEKKDPAVHYVKVVMDGKIVGYGHWHMYFDAEGKKKPEEEEKRNWPPVLGGIATLPAYQRLGVGSAIVKYGTDIADEANAPCWLEASPEGYPLYKKFGFEDKMQFTFDLEKYGSDYQNTCVGMWRPAKGERN